MMGMTYPQAGSTLFFPGVQPVMPVDAGETSVVAYSEGGEIVPGTVIGVGAPLQIDDLKGSSNFSGTVAYSKGDEVIPGTVIGVGAPLQIDQSRQISGTVSLEKDPSFYHT
jgi:hypothetical protein